MARSIWFVSDTHFDHANILKFTDKNGVKIRPWHDVNEMNEHMIQQWNSVVKPGDKIYHLGDFTMHRQLGQVKHILERLNGKKRLIRGNHDLAPTKEYMEYFDEIYGVRVFSKQRIMCSHIPLERGGLTYKKWFNVHGHLHNNPSPGPMYMNISVEQINYTPIHYDVLVEKAKEYRQSVETDSY